ncbi:MAG: SDR family oxidoreductase [Salinarimonas sp.]|nr:SDR family oxidoreductase [Salinarimonas sp.]
MAMRYPSLRGRVVIVTGGGRGLGREMALALAEEGAHVAITGARASGELDATAAQAAGLPGRMMPLTCDVGDAQACTDLVARVAADLGPVAVLINNAGRGMRLVSETYNREPTRFWETDPQAWAEIVTANLNGMFHMSRAVAPGMIARGFGKIINISTSDQTMVRRGYAPYGPSKAAMEAASRVFAQDLAGTGVDVNVLLPGGAADTALLPDGPGKKGADGNLLSPAIMRAPALWLSADESNGHTGARYIARLWDDTLPADEAVQLARSAPVEKPAIM